MAYLEENKFSHGDLRAAKCLMGENNIVKVSGHGLVELFESELLDLDICKKLFCLILYEYLIEFFPRF